MISQDMLDNYEVDHPEPILSEIVPGDFGLRSTMESVFRHMDWLDARWEFFRKYVYNPIKEEAVS